MLILSAQSFSPSHARTVSTLQFPYCGGGWVGGERKPNEKNLVIFILMQEKYQRVFKFQISSRLVIRNPVKIDPILHPGVGSLKDEVCIYGHLGGQDPSEMSWRSCVSNFVKIGHQEPRQDWPRPPSWSWILKGWGLLWWASWWSGSIRNVMKQLGFKFHQDWSSGTLSRWPPSSILELDLRWWWVKTEGGWVIRMTLVMVLVDYNHDCDLINFHHIWPQLT